MNVITFVLHSLAIFPHTYTQAYRTVWDGIGLEMQVLARLLSELLKRNDFYLRAFMRHFTEDIVNGPEFE